MLQLIIDRLTRRQQRKRVEVRRLTQAHFEMMRALEYLGGYWNSGAYCPWRTGRTRWESASRRRHVHEVLLNHDNRAKQLDYVTRSYGPSRQDCISLCEELTKRRFVESRPGIPKCFVLTARGKEVIGATAHVGP